ncbi:MAG: hypothetical protein K8L99_34420 [Anaerolineae bacterium]|nr:hypothetical protein [Anaerolineae bacterium]
MNRLFSRLDPGYWVAALLPLIGILPAFGSGVIRTADGPLHTQRIFAMTTLLQSGNLWPRWVPYFHLGYGYPVFNFYPPGTFYLGGMLGLLGISAPLAFNLITALAWIVGSVGMYGLARHYLPGKAALLAAILWTYAPSRLFEVWDQGSLPQIIAAALVPWLIWGMVRLAERPTPRRMLAVALPCAGIILSHQPITFIAALYAAPAAIGLPLWYSQRNGRDFLHRFGYMSGAFLLAAGLSAIFLLPMALELRYVQAVESPDDTIPYLISNFLQPAEVFMQPPLMDLTDLRFELFTTFGLVGGVLAGLGLVGLVRRRRFVLAGVLGFALAFTLFMLLEPSLPVWLTIPYFKQLRFPERFLRVGVVFLSLAAGASLLLLPQRWRAGGLVAGGVVVLIGALPMVYANQSFIEYPAMSARDEIDMELTYYTWGSTSYNEFNPIWGETIRHDPPPEPEEYATHPLRLTVYRNDMIQQWPDLQVEELTDNTFRITVSDERPVRFRQYYFPGWAATVDDQPAEIYPESEIGLITLDLPPGEHRVHLYYAGTPVQAIGTVITLVSLVIVVGLAVFASDHTAVTFDTDPLSMRVAGAAAASVIGFAIINTAIIGPQTMWFRYQSPPDDPVYMAQPIGANFGEVFELMGYTLPQDSVTSGGLLSVELFWRALAETETAYRPIVQLVNLNVDSAWAVSEPFSPGGGSTTFGYPLDRFASEVHELRLNADTPPYLGRILVKMLDEESGEALRLPDGSDHLLLEPLIRVTGSGLAVQQTLDYRLGDVAELWCASVSLSDQTYQVDLYWHTLGSTTEPLKTFVHGLDASGEIIAQTDAETMQGDYPSSYWLSGQTLHDRYSLPADESITALAVGLYTPQTRLPVTQNGQPVPDDRVLLDLQANACER